MLEKMDGIAVYPASKAVAVTETRYVLQPHGFLESMEIVPLKDCPNMDAAQPYVLSVNLKDGWGRMIPVHVRSLNRDVKVCDRVSDLDARHAAACAKDNGKDWR